MFNKQLFLGKSELAGHPLSFLSPFVPLNNLWGQVVQVFMVTAQKPIWGIWGRVFLDQMCFLSPNQQHRSTEGNIRHFTDPKQ